MYRRAVEREWGGLAESERTDRTSAERTIIDCTTSGERRATTAGQP